MFPLQLTWSLQLVQAADQWPRSLVFLRRQNWLMYKNPQESAQNRSLHVDVPTGMCIQLCLHMQVQGFADRRNAGAFGVQLSYFHLLLLPVWPRLELRNEQWSLQVVKHPLSYIKITSALSCQSCIICITTSPAKPQTDLPNCELSPQITLIKASIFCRVQIRNFLTSLMTVCETSTVQSLFQKPSQTDLQKLAPLLS